MYTQLDSKSTSIEKSTISPKHTGVGAIALHTPRAMSGGEPIRGLNLNREFTVKKKYFTQLALNCIKCHTTRCVKLLLTQTSIIGHLDLIPSFILNPSFDLNPSFILNPSFTRVPWFPRIPSLVPSFILIYSYHPGKVGVRKCWRIFFHGIRGCLVGNKSEKDNLRPVPKKHK